MSKMAPTRKWQPSELCLRLLPSVTAGHEFRQLSLIAQLCAF